MLHHPTLDLLHELGLDGMAKGFQDLTANPEGNALSHAEWTPERMQRQARDIGPHTEALIIAMLSRRPHPEQGFRTCLGVLRLFRGLAPARAEAVSARALEIGALTYKSVASILAHNLDRRPPAPPADGPAILHANIRGSRYFH